MENHKKIIYLDMDDTIADFMGHPKIAIQSRPYDVSYMYEPGFFRSLKPTEGSQWAVRKLIRLGFDVQILSQPVAESAHSYSEKAEWIGMYFPDLIKKINLTQDKGLYLGGYLIDDNVEKWKEKFEATGGKFVHFEYWTDHKRNWETIVDYFISEAKKWT